MAVVAAKYMDKNLDPAQEGITQILVYDNGEVVPCVQQVFFSQDVVPDPKEYEALITVEEAKTCYLFYFAPSTTGEEICHQQY